MRIAIVKDGVVRNVVVVPDDWNGRDGQWAPPPGAEVVVSETATIGWVRDGEALRAPVPAFDLSRAVARARREIDLAAENARLTWITAGSGQALVYQHKQAEAAALDAVGGNGEAADYPLLAASIGIEGETLADVAAVVLGTRAQWLGVAATIERIRLGAKHQLSSLGDDATAADVDAIVAAAVFPVSNDA